MKKFIFLLPVSFLIASFSSINKSKKTSEYIRVLKLTIGTGNAAFTWQSANDMRKGGCMTMFSWEQPEPTVNPPFTIKIIEIDQAAFTQNSELTLGNLMNSTPASFTYTTTSFYKNINWFSQGRPVNNHYYAAQVIHNSTQLASVPVSFKFIDCLGPEKKQKVDYKKQLRQ
jgi:hypothetical protein